MRYRLAEYIGNFLVTKTSCFIEKKESIVYGLWNLLTIIMLLTILGIIKIITKALFSLNVPIFTVYISFSVLRVYLGGFHLTNTNVCLVATTILTLMCSLISYYISLNLYIMATMYIVGYIVIYIVGVIDNKNKRYNIKRKVRYQKYGFILLTGLLIINVIVYMNNSIVISNALVIGMLMEISNLVLGKYTYKN